MALTVALNRMKQINMRKYTGSKGKGYALDKVKAPKKNKKVRNSIHYYHILQFIAKSYTEYKKSDATKWKKGLKKVYANSKKISYNS